MIEKEAFILTSIEEIIKDYEKKVYKVKHAFKKAKKAKRISGNKISICFSMYCLSLKDDYYHYRKFVRVLNCLKMHFND